MAMKHYNKLVRDKIPGICQASGNVPVTKTLTSDAAYLHALTQKLCEEAAETDANPCLEELADVLEVVQAIGKQLGYAPSQIESARRKKRHERGGFDGRIFLLRTD